MSAPDWYRQTEWTKAASEEFEKRLSRTRAQRSEYLRIQALTLADTRKPKYAAIAVDLAKRYLELEPTGLFSAQVYATIGRALETLGDISSAVEAYRSAVEMEFQKPNSRGYYYIEFAWFVAVHSLINNYEEALLAMSSNKRDEDLMFPSNQYRYFGSLALILSDTGDKENAQRMAKNALTSAAKEKGPFWRYPGIGVVKGGTDAARTKIHLLAG